LEREIDLRRWGIDIESGRYPTLPARYKKACLALITSAEQAF
jgi:hypothetical protein